MKIDNYACSESELSESELLLDTSILLMNQMRLLLMLMNIDKVSTSSSESELSESELSLDTSIILASTGALTQPRRHRPDGGKGLHEAPHRPPLMALRADVP